MCWVWRAPCSESTENVCCSRWIRMWTECGLYDSRKQAHAELPPSYAGEASRTWTPRPLCSFKPWIHEFQAFFLIVSWLRPGTENKGVGWGLVLCFDFKSVITETLHLQHHCVERLWKWTVPQFDSQIRFIPLGEDAPAREAAASRSVKQLCVSTNYKAQSCGIVLSICMQWDHNTMFFGFFTCVNFSGLWQ